MDQNGLIDCIELTWLIYSFIIFIIILYIHMNTRIIFVFGTPYSWYVSYSPLGVFVAALVFTLVTVTSPAISVQPSMHRQHVQSMLSGHCSLANNVRRDVWMLNGHLSLYERGHLRERQTLAQVQSTLPIKGI